jgi:hypothetical protein
MSVVKMPRHEWLGHCKTAAGKHLAAGNLEGAVVGLMQLLGQHLGTFDLTHFEGVTGWELAENRDATKLSSWLERASVPPQGRQSNTSP